MKDTRKNLILISVGILIGLIFGILLIFWNNYYDRKYAQKYLEFYAKDFRGVITYLNGSGGKYHFRIDDGEKYFLSPFRVSEEQKTFFHVASEGDSLIKTAFSDTVIIISDSIEYKYTFKDYTKY